MTNEKDFLADALVGQFIHELDIAKHDGPNGYYIPGTHIGYSDIHSRKRWIKECNEKIRHYQQTLSGSYPQEARAIASAEIPKLHDLITKYETEINNLFMKWIFYKLKVALDKTE